MLAPRCVQNAAAAPVGCEYIGLVIATIDDVIEGAWALDSELSRHLCGQPLPVAGAEFARLQFAVSADLLLTGNASTRLDPLVWPSAFRGIGPTPTAHLDLREEVKPIEQHGFTIADFLSDRIELRFFKWDLRMQSPEEIDRLVPFHTTTLTRPAGG